MNTLNSSFTSLDTSAHALEAGDLRSVFLPSLGMLGASFTHRGEELLGRLDDVAGFAREGRTCGIPLLYPWANRLGGLNYAAAGASVSLDRASPLLHFDSDMPIHGVPWGQLAWRVVTADATTLQAALDWTTAERLRVFPFPHRVEMEIAQRPSALEIATTIVADAGSAVPVSFGFHPFVRLPNLARDAWRIASPVMRRFALDARHIPSGEDAPFAALDSTLAGLEFDDGFALLEPRAKFAVAGGGRRITFDFVEGYPFAQLFAPRGSDFIAIEPMTAPTNALVSGRGLRVVAPGQTFRATFRVGVDALADSPTQGPKADSPS